MRTEPEAPSVQSHSCSNNYILMHINSIIRCKLTCSELILLSLSYFIDGNTEAGQGLIDIFVNLENHDRHFHNFELILKEVLIK